MLRYLLAIVLFLVPTVAKAVDSTVSAMTAAGALGGTELFYVVQGGADRKATPAQINTYVLSLMGTGVGTALGINVGTAGAFVVNGGALGTPTSGVATNLTGTAASLTAGTVTTNANLTGMITSVGNATSLGSFTSANLLAALTTKTGTGSAVFGSAPTIDSLNATTAATLAFITGSTQCLQVNSTGVVSGTGAVCGGAGSTGANPTATAGPTAVNGVATTFLRSDGAPAIQLGTAAQKGIVQVDGTTITASAGVISGPALGTNVATALANTLSAAGGVTSTIASGTSALGTIAIGSAACATVVTTAATNVATTDVVLASFNGDPTAVTGYTPVTTGALTIFPYPTLNNVNFKVCNLTSSSITPGAITLNWRVVR